MDLKEKELNMKALYNFVSKCSNCPLCQKKTYSVLGEGNILSEVMFVGEGPGHDEDLTGRPFVGKAGQLLTKMIEAIGLKRDEVYICNIVKCRPPENRVPADDEAKACLPHLRKQVAIIRPKIIVCLGSTAAKYILDPNIKITKDRGIWHEKAGVYIIATFHPSALLRDPGKKVPAWEDFKSIKSKLEELGKNNA